jgi:hypothetical protein
MGWTFGEGLEEIVDVAFVGCTSHLKIIMPPSVKAINHAAFSGCLRLSLRPSAMDWRRKRGIQ